MKLNKGEAPCLALRETWDSASHSELAPGTRSCGRGLLRRKGRDLLYQRFHAVTGVHMCIHVGMTPAVGVQHQDARALVGFLDHEGR